MKNCAVLTVGFVAVLLAVAGAQQAQRYDLLIKSGRVMDGTGNPWFPADIAVQGGRIVAIGPLPNAQAARVIDASGKYVTPGFIDIHSHADDGSSPQERNAHFGRSGLAEFEELLEASALRSDVPVVSGGVVTFLNDAPAGGRMLFV